VLTVNSGTATVPTISLNNTTGTINLNGGTLAMNNITRTAGTNTINLNGGTLQARQNNAAFIAAGVNAINAVSTSTIDTNGFDVSINSAISGSGTINKNNGGKLTLTANNPFNGSLVVNAGTLALAPTSAATFAGNASGAGALEIGGTGTVNLSGTNTHLGGTTVLNGASLAGEGSVSGALTFNGTHNFLFDPSTTGANQYFRAGSINAGGATISVVPSGIGSGPGIVVMEAAGGITGTIGVNFLGNSRLSLSYNGPSQTQLLANYTPASLKWTGTDGTNPTFWDTGVTANWDNGGPSDVFLAGDNVLFDDTALEYAVAVQAPIFPGNMTFDGGTDYTVSGAAIGGGGSLTKDGEAFLFLNTANTYSGTTTINAGTLVAGSNTALGSNAGGTTVATGGTLDINGKNLGTEVITISGDGGGSGAIVNNGLQQIDAIGRLVLGANAAIGGAGTRWDIRNSSPTLDMGGFTLTKTGSNYVGLVGVTVSNPDDIDVSEGTLSIQNSTTLGGSSANTVTVRPGATLDCYQSGTWTAPEWSLVLEDDSFLSASNGLAIWNGPVSGGKLTKSGTASLALAGINSYTGPTNVTAGSLIAQSTTALGTTAAGTTVASGGRVELDNLTITGENITIAGTGGNFFGALQGRAGTSVWTGNVIVDADQTRIGAQAGATLDVAGVISSTADHNVVFRPADATATVILSNANTYTGPTSVIGGVVSVSDIGSVAGGASNFGSPTSVANGTIKMSAGATGTLRYTGNGEITDRVIDLAGTTFGAFIEQAGQNQLKFTSDLTATGLGSKTLVLSGSTTGTGELAGAIVNNSVSNVTGLRKDGTGTWTVSGPNTFTGSVTINGGVLRITNSSGLGTGVKNITINASADKLLELDGSGGNITLPADFSFFTSGTNGVIRNTAGDNVINGTFTMTVGNGNTKIISDNAGSLTLNGNIAANTTTRVLDLGGDSVGNNAFNGVLSNASSPGLAKSGTGTWTLNGVNLYTGLTDITGGTLVLGSTGSIDASTSLSVAAGAELDTTAKSSHALPATVTIGLDGDTETNGLIDATGQALDIDGANVTFAVTGTLDAPSYVIAKYNSITGSPAFASITPPSGYSVDYGTGPSGEIKLVQSGSDYDEWLALYPSITDPNDKLTTADPDGDGLTNQEEYAFGLAPNSGSSVNPILVQLDKTTGTFTYQRRSSTGLDYTIWTSPNLGTWTEDLTASATQNEGTPDGNNVQSVVVTLTGAPFTADKLFVRVKASE
jgi:autotransporter-associated beta strand protein